MFIFIAGMMSGATIGFTILALVSNEKYLKKIGSAKQKWCDGGCNNCAYTDNCVFYEENER